MKKTRYRVSLRLTALLSALIMLLALLPVYAADSSGLTVTLGDASARAGETVIIPVTVTNNPGIAALRASLVYDDTSLEFMGASVSELGGSVEIDETVLWMNTENVHGDGVLLLLAFRLITDPSAPLTVSIAFDDGSIANKNEQSITATVKPATVSRGSCEHELDVIPASFPGCVYSGTTEGEYCKKCGVITDYPDEIPPFGHMFTGGVCAVCGLELDGKPTLTLSSAIVGAGQQLYVFVDIVNSPGIAAIMMTPVYDTDLLELVSVEFNRSAFSGISNWGSRIVSAMNHDVSGTFTYAVLIFNVKRDGYFRTEVSMELERGSFVDMNEMDIIFALEPATIVHSCAEGAHTFVDVPAAEPTCTQIGWDAYRGCIYCLEAEGTLHTYPALGHTFKDGACTRCGEPGIQGDVNSDGKVDTKDLVRLMKLISGVDVVISGQDVNGDGKVDTRDLIRLMKIIAEAKSAEA